MCAQKCVSRDQGRKSRRVEVASLCEKCRLSVVFNSLCRQAQNKLNRKLLRHIVRKVLAGVSVNLQTVHVRFELPAGGVDAGTPVKASAGVGGGGACDAVGVMLPTLAVRSKL